MNDLKPHQTRVIDEKQQLENRIQKLQIFIDSPLFVTVDPSEQFRLHRQLRYMQQYLGILVERIAAF